jgi:hypothetical protein
VFTCAQPQACSTHHISFSMHLKGESSRVSHHLKYMHRGDQYIISSLSQRELHTQLMGFLTPHRGTQRSIFVLERNHTPISWTHPNHGLPHPTQGHTMFLIYLREEQHTHLMGTPNSWALSQADSLSLCLGGCLMQL